MESRRGRQKSRAAASDYVAENVGRLRTARHLSQQDLALRLAEVGRPMPPSTLSKIEGKSRVVDVDDLIALALALRVNPSALLLPPRADDTEIALTPTRTAPAWAAWQWADGANPLPTGTAQDEQGYNSEAELEDFQDHARPRDLRRESRHPLMLAGMRLLLNARRLIHHSTRPVAADDGKVTRGLDGSLVIARRHLRRFEAELDAIEEQEVERG